MTLSEALNLPAGRKFDAVVAWKVFGWNSSIIETADELAMLPGTSADQLLPYYSSSIDAAFGVVERLRERWPVCRIEVQKNWYRVEYFQPSYQLDDIAQSLPLAICRAALRCAWAD
jgi:hypothetical protein